MKEIVLLIVVIAAILLGIVEPAVNGYRQGESSRDNERTINPYLE